MRTGLYLHIPFCHARCHYCDFATFTGREGQIDRYLAALAKEIGAFGPQSLETVFVGGGTPTVLEPTQWKVLFGDIERMLVEEGHEATVECNPESVTPEKLAAFRETGVNRLSFGLQATQDRLLKALNRVHDFARFETVFRQARAAGFDNLNVDLMYGLPGQTIEDWRDTLSCVLESGPEHISAYALSVEEDTVLDRTGVTADDDLQADMYEEAASVLESAGYVHYEISNFAKPGRECRHNLRYWRNQPTLGAGVSAAWFDGRVRRQNTDSLDDYLQAVEAGRSPVVEEAALAEPERVGEDLMLALRLKEGVAPAPQARLLYGSVLHRFRNLGFLTENNGHFRPTRQGWRLSNQLFQELLSPVAPSV